ncbi:MAG: AmmeMemoRadiSam system protein A [Actinomycetota bacterium]|nr:AmmeMemoRadiSam system protein A [Actinomycetota bacterium]
MTAEHPLEGLSPDDMQRLVHVAEQAVESAVLHGATMHPDVADYPRSLAEPGAAFVTLRRHGRLRGCIGTLVAADPLVVAVADKARAAALADPRFDPVGPAELDDLEVSVSVLSAPRPLVVGDFDGLVVALQPGIDGVVVEAGHHRATFLPSVWEELSQPLQFLDALWRKAGLLPRSWPHGIAISRYGAQHAPVEGHERLSDR